MRDQTTTSTNGKRRMAHAQKNCMPLEAGRCVLWLDLLSLLFIDALF